MEETKEVTTLEEITLDVENKKPTRKEKKQLKKQEKIDKMLSYGNGTDIKRSGLFGIRGMRILAWMALNCNAIALLVTVGGSLGYLNEVFAKICTYAFAIVGELAIPCFLIAKFAVVLRKQETIFKTIRSYCLIALAVSVVFVVFVAVYAYGVLRVIHPEWNFEVGGPAYEIITNALGQKVSFNIFIDMAMMSLVMFFANYQKEGWGVVKTRLFKCCSIFPILYMVAGFILKTLQLMQVIRLSIVFFPLLPTSSVIGFFAVITIFFYIKKYRHDYFKKGGSQEQFANFQKSKANSRVFSKISAVIFIIFGIIDLFLAVIFTALAQNNDIYRQLLETLEIGNSTIFIGFAPILFLFDYKAEFKNDKVDLLVPLSGIGMLVFIYFNCIFLMVIRLISIFTAV